MLDYVHLKLAYSCFRFPLLLLAFSNVWRKTRHWKNGEEFWHLISIKLLPCIWTLRLNLFSYGRKMTTVLLALWNNLLSWWDDSSTEELKRSTVILMRNILRIDPKVYVYVLRFYIQSQVVSCKFTISKIWTPKHVWLQHLQFNTAYWLNILITMYEST